MNQRTWLRELRGTRTQREFAEELEIDRTYYCQLEKGKRGISVALARELAEKLNIPWTYFFDDSDLG